MKGFFVHKAKYKDGEVFFNRTPFNGELISWLNVVENEKFFDGKNRRNRFVELLTLHIYAKKKEKKQYHFHVSYV